MKLILHVGAGKTGTSSIQKMLKDNRSLLKEEGVWYLGMLLEFAERKFEWQRPSLTRKFLNMDRDLLRNQLTEVMIPTIKQAKKEGMHALIWSNEAFFGAKPEFIDVLHEVEKEVDDIEILAYVRRHHEWVKSAYVQWGIKHKTYKGKVKPFSQWIKKRDIGFFSKIDRWEQGFPGKVRVRNMSAADDVCADFLQYLGMKNIEKYQWEMRNRALGDEELLLRVLFNDQYDERIKAKHFDLIFGEEIPSDGMEKFLESYLPSTAELKDIARVSEEDRKKINELLSKEGQDILDAREPKEKNIEIDHDRMMLLLANMVMMQSKKIVELEKRLPMKKANGKQDD